MNDTGEIELPGDLIAGSVGQFLGEPTDAERQQYESELEQIEAAEQEALLRHSVAFNA